MAQSFYPRLTGAENLEFFALLNDLPPRVARDRIREVLSFVGLERDGQMTFQCYSDGKKQRLSLARALLREAPVLLLDEPTKALDPQKQSQVRQFIRRTLVDELGRTVLLVTHSVAEAQATCDRVVLLREGRVARVGHSGRDHDRRHGTRRSGRRLVRGPAALFVLASAERP